MVKSLFSIIALSVFAVSTMPAPASAQQTPSSQSGAASNLLQLPPNPAVAKRAIEWLHRLELGNIDRSQLDATLNAKLSPQAIGLIQAELGPFGTPKSITLAASRPMNGNSAYLYILDFKAAKLQEVMILNPSGKITGLVFTPTR
jgi:hypothetical protein